MNLCTDNTYIEYRLQQEELYLCQVYIIQENEQKYIFSNRKLLLAIMAHIPTKVVQFPTVLFDYTNGHLFTLMPDLLIKPPSNRLID